MNPKVVQLIYSWKSIKKWMKTSKSSSLPPILVSFSALNDGLSLELVNEFKQRFQQDLKQLVVHFEEEKRQRTELKMTTTKRKQEEVILFYLCYFNLYFNIDLNLFSLCLVNFKIETTNAC